MQTSVLNIEAELNQSNNEKLIQLRAQTEAIKAMTPEVFDRQAQALDRIEDQATPAVREVLAHMGKLHDEFNGMLMSYRKAGRPSREGYIKYLMQAWYHTSYTPEFERMFAQRLSDYLKKDTSNFDAGNKFVRLIEEGADEELGHEIWALEDIQRLGGPKEIDLLRDILPEARALVRTQFDRLTRLNFVGFLGYSFYLEFWVAKYSVRQLQMMRETGIVGEAQSFVRNHYAVDQGHAADNIELLNFLIRSQEDVVEVIDNMDVIHALYYDLVDKSFSQY